MNSYPSGDLANRKASERREAQRLPLGMLACEVFSVPPPINAKLRGQIRHGGQLIL